MSEPRDSTSSSDESGRVPRLSTSDLAGRVFRGLMAPDADAPQRPPLIDGYRLLTPLGLGGQGTTWLAEREGAKENEPCVAIKVLRYSARGFPQHYWTELEALKNLRVEGMPRILDSGISEGHPWFASELVEGINLAELDSGATRFEKVTMIARAADVLHRIHCAGYLHRDIKPSNIMVRASDGAVVLVDFGLACRTTDAAAAPAMVGTASFMSPEQARGEACTAASDQWSLAATAFALLVATTPHPIVGDHQEQLALARDATPRATAAVDATIPKAIARVLDRALNREPRRRFANCADFAFALRNAGSGAPVLNSMRRHAPVLTLVLAAAIVATPIVLQWLTRRLPPIPVGGDYPLAEFGQSIATIGDLDGDGIDEVAIGAPGCPARTDGPWIPSAGTIHIINGAKLANAAIGIREPLAQHELTGMTELGRIGECLGAIGDVDGDGIADLATIVNTPLRRQSALLVIRGEAAFARAGRTDLRQRATRIVPIDTDRGPLKTITGFDLDGDGLNEVVVGEINAGVERQGRLLVLHGARGFFTDAAIASHVVAPPASVRGFGCTVLFAAVPAIGDRAATTLAIIGAPLGEQSDARDDLHLRGQVVIVDARSLSDTAAPRVLRSITAARADDWFGCNIDAAVIGNQLRMAVGASAIAHDQDDGGRAYLLEIPLAELDGRASPIDLDAAGGERYLVAQLRSPTVTANGAGDTCGYQVALVPGGWCVSAPRADTGADNAGRVWLGPPGAEQPIDGEQRLERLGESLGVWRLHGRIFVLAGAPVADFNGNLAPGAARIFEADFPTNAQ